VGESNLTTDGDPINPNLTIPNLTGAFSPSVAFSWNPAEITLPNTGLVIRLTNENFAGRTLNINPNLGYIPAQIGYRILPNLAWTIIDQQPEWTAASIVITLPAAKADGDVDIVFPDVEGSTLPVELSSFTAIPATDCNSVSLSWTVESETDHLGYDIIRSLDNNLNHAQKVNSFIITEGSHTGTQIVFHYNDADLENAETYFYWLASSSLGGEIEFYGPISVNLSASPDGNEPPVIPNLTALQNAYPNPFNPNVTIAYTLEKAADVRIHIFNNKGQMVRILLDATKAAGTAHLVWDGKSDNGDNLPSGIYYVQMQAENSKSTRKIVMLK
jgi:hypothetical protein